MSEAIFHWPLSSGQEVCALADHERVVAALNEAHEKALADALIEGEQRVIRHGIKDTQFETTVAEAVAAALHSNAVVTASLEQPRTLTADEPDVPVNSVAVFISRPSGCPGIVRKYPDGSWNGKPWSFFVQDDKRPVAVVPAEPIRKDGAE